MGSSASSSALLGKGLQGRVVVTKPRGTEGTFGYFIFPIDLGARFRYNGVLFQVVHLPGDGRDTIGALCLEGSEANYVHRFTDTVSITDVALHHPLKPR